MTQRSRLWFGLVLVVSLLFFPLAASAESRIEVFTIQASSLAGNLLGDPVEQKAAVYFPPGYESNPSRRFPVLYLLHGIGGTYTDWTEDFEIRSIADRLIAKGTIGELLIVMPNGRNAYMGGFYMNSPVTGNWEDFITKELVAFVDGRFQTLPGPEGRGLAGHSMGGFGAIHLGMKHPDVFGAVYALSPCCLDFVEDVDYGNASLRGALESRSREDLMNRLQKGDFYPIAVVALAAVLSPNPERPPFFVDLPFETRRGELLPVLPVRERWLAQFPVHQVPQYLSNLRRLRGIVMDYGTLDQFAHIPEATANFSRKLAEYKVPHTLDVYEGDHRQEIPVRLERMVLPFFSRLFFGER
jgi:S-formylglutathione hydrolase